MRARVCIRDRNPDRCEEAPCEECHFYAVLSDEGGGLHAEDCECSSCILESPGAICCVPEPTEPA